MKELVWVKSNANWIIWQACTKTPSCSYELFLVLHKADKKKHFPGETDIDTISLERVM